MTGTSSTTTPFSGSNASSTNQSPSFTVPTPTAPAERESRFNTSDFVILGISMVLTGVIGFFSSLMAVKADIAQNSKEISVISEKLSNALGKIDGAEDDLDKLKSMDKDLALINLKLSHLEKSSSNTK
ncbi:hypothetical protein [Vibrio cidicii]|uniref:hypothetical protein n=1 Tax=Vibrio cidicii TaxID=1763883 RepID=UPI0018C2FE2D|nr:hypothetical protein [Vibrio cidicii]